jgi:hypothetical protein
MASPYRSTVAYRGDSFVSMCKPKATNVKGKKENRSAGMTPEEKNSLYASLYTWKETGPKAQEDPE